MTGTPIHTALVETASETGVAARRRYLREHGPHRLGWSYLNILEVDKTLRSQLARRGYFNLYLFIPDENGGRVRYRMRITAITTYHERTPFTDPVDGKNYLVHSSMTIDAIDELETGLTLDDLVSADHRKPDVRHLQLGFLFVADPELQHGPA